MVLLGGSVHLTTLFLGRFRLPEWLTSTKCNSFEVTDNCSS